VRFALWDMTGWHGIPRPLRVAEPRKPRTARRWEIMVRWKIIAAVPHEAHGGRSGEAMDALEEADSFYGSQGRGWWGRWYGAETRSPIPVEGTVPASS